MTRLLALLMLAGTAFAQTTTTYTGTIKDLSQNPVTSGQVTFTLAPATDSTLPSSGRFVPTTITCAIQSDGTLKNQSSSGPCVVTQNTALTPTGTSYRICIQPNFVNPGSCFFDYATTATKDISTIAPTLSTAPINYNLTHGVPGPAGISPTITVGSVTLAPSTALPSVTNSGTSTNAIFNFSLPQGIPGPAGTTTYNGSNGPFVSPSLNYVIDANQQPGTDLGAKFNAAFAACSFALNASLPGNAVTSGCAITFEAQPGQLYTYSTPIVMGSFPPQAHVNVSCNQASLQYTGSSGTIGWNVQGGNLYHVMWDGCNLVGNNTANVIGMRWDVGAGFNFQNGTITHFAGTGSCGLYVGATDTSNIVNNDFHDNYESICGYGSNAVRIIGNHFYGDTHLPVDFFGSVGGAIFFEENTFDPPSPSAIAFAHFHSANQLVVAKNYWEGNINPSGTLGFGLLLTGSQRNTIVEKNWFVLTYGGTMKAPVLYDSNDGGGCFSHVIFRDNFSGGGDSEFVDQTEDCAAGSFPTVGLYFDHNYVGTSLMGTTLIGRTGNGTAVSNYSTSTTPIYGMPPSLFGPIVGTPGASGQLTYMGVATGFRGMYIPYLVHPYMRCQIDDNNGHSVDFVQGANFGMNVASYIACQDGSFNGPVNGTTSTAAAGSNNGAIANTQYADRAVANLRALLAGGTPTINFAGGQGSGSISGNDANPVVTFTLSATSTAGTLTTVTYGTPASANTPQCVSGNGDVSAAARATSVTSTTPNGFTMGISAGIAAGTYTIRLSCPRF